MSLTALLEKYAPCTVEHHGRLYSFRQSGKGERTLVLLHGIGTDSASWVQQLHAFAPYCKVIAWDAPGYGQSTPVDAASPVDADYAQALLGLFEALKIKRALLVGQSLGAIMAGAFAARHPERVEKLVLTGAAGGYGAAPAEERAAKLAARVKQMTEQGPEGMALGRGANMLTEAAGEELRDFMAACTRRLNRAGYIQGAHLLTNAVLAQDAARYPAPTLVLSGSADKVTPEAGCRAIAQAFACGYYRALPDLGHGAYVEGAKVVNNILSTYFGFESQ
jgi:pimeloyl-ACP methyl ester carboxylesterase